MSERQTQILRAYDPEAMFQQLETACDKVAKAVYKEFILEKHEKILLSQLINEYQLNENITSISKAMHRALASKKYKIHIEGLAVAKEQLIRAKSKYENLKALAEARRTQESSARFIRDKV
tara:strand:- start:19 stop:381 length:363 start_codon:yes stop_codon:yes gene_type:complete